MRKGTPQLAALKRTLALLDEVVDDRRGLSEIAKGLGIPLSTAYRQIATLVAEGYLVRLASGHHSAGPRLLRLLSRVDEKQAIANAAAPVLNRLAGQLGAIVQLGTLENEMVTYRIKAGRGAAKLFTQIGTQMEAYCTAIGKVLLAELPKYDLDAYLANGPFVALTERTIVTPDRLRLELERVRATGHAVDDGEAAEGLYCIAVPIRSGSGKVHAALSVTRTRKFVSAEGSVKVVDGLLDAARELGRVLG